jgi:hypothetical protein
VNKTYPYLLGVSALSISISSAYYSIYGLGALFAGAAIQIMIMAGTLEFAKIVLAGFLHRFWNNLHTLLRYYLSVAVLILIVISSMGVYGYLAAAYKTSSIEMNLLDGEVQILENRKSRYSFQIDTINEERQRITNTILTLSQGLSGNTLQYVDSQTGMLVTTQSAATRNILQEQINIARQRESFLFSQIQVALDSISGIDQQLLSITQQSSASKNLGPLLFLSEVTGAPMNKVVNILIVFIMIVFDPLAVTMIIATSIAFLKVSEQSSIPEISPTEEKEDIKVQDNPQPDNTPTKEESSSSKNLKIKEARPMSNYIHVTYEDNTQDRIEKNRFKKLEDSNRIRYL